MKIRSEVHKRFIGEQPCMITGRMGSDVASHHLLRVQPIKGIATKACDSWLVPLYWEIHNALHANGNEEVFFANHGFDYERVKLYATDLARQSPDKKIRDAAVARMN